MEEDRRKKVKDKIKALKKIRYKDREIASLCGVTITTIHRWKTSGGIQEDSDYDALMRIPTDKKIPFDSTGKPMVQVMRPSIKVSEERAEYGDPQPPPGVPSAVWRFFKEERRELMGHIRQLQSQVKESQGDIAVLKTDHDRKISESEKKIRELSEAVAAAIKQMGGSSPREASA